MKKVLSKIKCVKNGLCYYRFFFIITISISFFSSTSSNFYIQDIPCYFYRIKSPSFLLYSEFKNVPLKQLFCQELLFCGTELYMNASLDTAMLTSSNQRSVVLYPCFFFSLSTVFFFIHITDHIHHDHFDLPSNLSVS